MFVWPMIIAPLWMLDADDPHPFTALRFAAEHGRHDPVRYTICKARATSYCTQSLGVGGQLVATPERTIRAKKEARHRDRGRRAEEASRERAASIAPLARLFKRFPDVDDLAPPDRRQLSAIMTAAAPFPMRRARSQSVCRSIHVRSDRPARSSQVGRKNCLNVSCAGPR
jgi:hypothetical protein